MDAYLRLHWVHLVSIEDIVDVPADIDHCHGCLDTSERESKVSNSRVALNYRDRRTMHILPLTNRRPGIQRLRENGR